jgi:hypothetical protein
LTRQKLRKRNTIKNFFANRWVYGILLALVPTIFDRLLALKTPIMDRKILQNLKKFFAIRFTLVIPIWIPLSIGLLLIFILVKCIFFRSKK